MGGIFSSKKKSAVPLLEINKDISDKQSDISDKQSDNKNDNKITNKQSCIPTIQRRKTKKVTIRSKEFNIFERQPDSLETIYEHEKEDGIEINPSRINESRDTEQKIYYKKELDQIQNTSGSNYFANSNMSNDSNKELNITVKNHRRSILKK